MKIHPLTIVLSAIMLSLQACNVPEPERIQSTSAKGYVMVLDDFETKTEISRWTGSISLTKENPSHGRTSCKLSSFTGEPLVLESLEIPEDWSSFEYLKFDIFNPSDRLYFGSIQIFDRLGTDEQAEFNGQSYNGEKLFLNTGWNHFEFLLRQAMVEEGNRALALDKIRRLRFYFGITENPLYIDNIRLVSGLERSATLSRADPRDCKVVVDNRDVYTSLVGPVEKIKTSNEIEQLREQALKAVQNLRTEVRVAEMQGFQTLYQRIPLITADVGMGIRNKLVWFQSETEEKKILDYVISSCNKAADDISSMMSSEKTSRIIHEPENEVSTASHYVPPYPLFEDLKPEDGYYRDESGKPFIIFSMLQINEGPLLDYFAPFSHRLESYTVGGGSRYNIESSPVYEAFHKHPGTHRVGWDGWCGHLIKDRWAMGGKKEDVVICLESPHIRQAVQDYIRLHHREWTDNPDLLYNIMAYELQYICYCEKSQQMFRDWLRSRYKSVSEINSIWNTSFLSFDEIKAPPAHNARPVDDVNRAAWYDWSFFNTERFTDYLKWIKSEMQKYEDDTPICAGGTSSMLSSSNSVTGIDEELIINELDDVILNESGGSVIFSDLLLSLGNTKKVMVDPEMGGSTHGILLQFLHGKSDISKWWWASYPSTEYMHMNQTSLPHSKEISLADIDEVLRIGLDVRRLGKEIIEFTKPDPEVAILYSKTSILQVPPHQVQAGTTPYIDAIYSVWEGTRFLGCRIGFISEEQILKGKLANKRILIVPAVKYIRTEIAESILKYVEDGGAVVMIPESFLFDQYARENNKIIDFGITITGVTLPEITGCEERKQNYDQSFSQTILYGESRRKITCLNEDLFSGNPDLLTLQSEGLVQEIDPGRNKVLASFEDGKPALVVVKQGKGSIYYFASPLRTEDYHLFFSPLAERTGLKRPVLAIDCLGNLLTGAEVRGIERENDFLVYASNLTSGQIDFELKGSKPLGSVTDLRSLARSETHHIKLEPFQETILKIEKICE